MFAHVLSWFLPETLSDFITFYPKESKFTRLMFKRAELQDFLGITQPQDVLQEMWPVLPHYLLHPQSLSSIPLIPGPE